MPITPSDADGGRSANRTDYRRSFVNRSHAILKNGYDRLDSASFAGSEEEDITGELSRAMQGSLEDLQAPLWAKNFSVIEEERVHDDKRLGKRRLRIDIAVIHHQRGPRPRFRFEAKRLRDTDSRRDYLGSEGLGCFLDGRYAKDDPDAGMLGYVQSDSPATHVVALREALARDSKRYQIHEGGEWREHPITKGLSTFQSVHFRTNIGSQIIIFHTLLDFCLTTGTGGN
jgi:hypothetical protein